LPRRSGKPFRKRQLDRDRAGRDRDDLDGIFTHKPQRREKRFNLGPIEMLSRVVHGISPATVLPFR